MSIRKVISNHRAQVRARRELSAAITNAATPGLRDELIVVSKSVDLTRQLR